MEKKTLLEILNEKPFSFTLREIEEIMDEELGKTPEDMDTDLIDLCVDILEREQAKYERTTAMNENQTFEEQVQKVKEIAEKNGYTVVSEGNANASSNAQFEKMAEDNLKEPTMVII